MSRQNKKALSSQYRDAPRLDSPDRLDQRILQAAEQYKPAKARNTAGWLPFLASACLGGIAVFFAMPYIQYDNETIRFDVKQERASEERFQTEFAASPAAVAVESKAEKSAVTIQKNVGATDQITITGLADEGPVVASELSDSAMLRENSVSTTIQSENQALSAKSQASAAAEEYLSLEEIDRILAEIRSLNNRKMTEQAQNLLDHLRARCHECELPKKAGDLE